jgi:hypothetical protein
MAGLRVSEIAFLKVADIDSSDAAGLTERGLQVGEVVGCDSPIDGEDVRAQLGNVADDYLRSRRQRMTCSCLAFMRAAGTTRSPP